MKKIVISILTGLMVMALATTAVPVLAADIGNQKDVVPPSPNVYYLGDTIDYETTITNLNETVDMRVDLVQDIFPDGSVQDLDPTVPFILGPLESRTYNTSWTTTATGVVVNTSRVAGAQLTTPIEDPFDSNVTKSSLVISPEIAIEKTVDCNGDGTFSDEETWYAGDTATWKIVVTNTGDSPVSNIDVSDTNGHAYTIPLLNPGESHTETYTTVVDVDTENIATAQGEDMIGGIVGPVSDNAVNLVISPEIAIEKMVDCNDDGVFLDEDTGTAGDTGHWRIVVSNTGDSPVYGIMVTDTNGMSFGPFDLPNPGDSAQFDYDTIVNETTTNTATAVGEDQLGGTVGPVSDSATNVVVGAQGCTPGYWKNNAEKWEAVSWVGYTPGQSFSSVFGRVIEVKVDKVMVTDPTLLEALSAKGGGINALARHAVAALLNASNPNISYPDSEAGIIAATQAAIDSGDKDIITAQKDQFDYWNNLGCSIDMHGNPINGG